MRTTILFIGVLLCHAAQGFTISRSMPSNAVVPFRRHRKMTSSTIVLRAKKQDSNEDELQTDEKDDSNGPNLFKKSFEFVLMRALDVTSFAFTFVGVASFCGLVLNFMGYGYHIGQGFTVEIDTLEHMRLQNEFQREIMRSMRDVA